MSATAIRLLPNGDPETGLGPAEAVNRANLLDGNPTEQGHTFFSTDDGAVTAGVWECTPCLELIERYGVDELCVVLSGRLIVTDDQGHAETFGPGDAFVMPRDFKGTWHITETLKKYWMIVTPNHEG
jgi:uncharacterized cupin superfamily protein